MNNSIASAPLVEAFEPRSDTDTRLSGYWLVLARLVCLTLCVLSVGFYVAGVLLYIAHDYLFCSGPAAACHTYGTVVVPPNQGPGLSRDVVGIYVVVRDSLFSLGYWLVAGHASLCSSQFMSSAVKEALYVNDVREERY